MTSSRTSEPGAVVGVEPDAAPCSSTGVGHRHVEFDTIIDTDGRVTVGPIGDDDWEYVGEKIMALMRAMCGSNPVVVTECVMPEQREAIAQRVAALLLRKGA